MNSSVQRKLALKMPHFNARHEVMHLKERQAAASSNGSDPSVASSATGDSGSTTTPDPTTTPTPTITPTPTPTPSDTTTPASTTPTTTAAPASTTTNDDSTTPASTTPTTTKAADSTTAVASTTTKDDPATTSTDDSTTAAASSDASSGAAAATTDPSSTDDGAAASSLIYSTTYISGTGYTLRHGTMYGGPITATGTSLSFGPFATTTGTNTVENGSSPSLGSAPSTSHAGKPLSESASAGIAIGVLLVLLAVVSAIVFGAKRRKHRKSVVLDAWIKALEDQQKPQVEETAGGLKQSASVKSYKLTEEEKLELQPYRTPYEPAGRQFELPPAQPLYEPMEENPKNELRMSRNQDFLTEMQAGPYGDVEPPVPALTLQFPFEEQPRHEERAVSPPSRTVSPPSPERHSDRDFRAIPYGDVSPPRSIKGETSVNTNAIPEERTERELFTPSPDQDQSGELRDGPYRRPVHRAERIKKLAVRFSVQHDHDR